jgi:uncharacterized membrane protein
MHGWYFRESDALSILQERFARGEISEDEYWRLKHTFES